MSLINYYTSAEYLRDIFNASSEAARHSSSAVYSLDVIERKLDKLLRLNGVNPMSEEFNPAIDVDAILAEVRNG